MTAAEKVMLEELQKTVDWMKEEQLGEKLFLKEAREQYMWYKQFVESAAGKPVVVHGWKVSFKDEEKKPEQHLLVLWDDENERWYDGFGDWYREGDKGWEVHVAGDSSVTWYDSQHECYELLSKVRAIEEVR